MASRLAFFAAATCALLLLAASASPPPPPAAVHRVVEAGWWTTVPSAGNGTDETLTQWAERQRFHVGDVLDFKAWNGSVILLARRGDYERCDTAASWGRQFEGGGGGGTDAGFVLYRPGIFYFASGVPGRCEAGLRMALRVVDARARAFLIGAGGNPALRRPAVRAPPAVSGAAAVRGVGDRVRGRVSFVLCEHLVLRMLQQRRLESWIVFQYCNSASLLIGNLFPL